MLIFAHVLEARSPGERTGAVRVTVSKASEIKTSLDPHVQKLDDRLAQPASIRALVRSADERIRDGRFQRSLALIAGISGIFTGLEVSLEHYRGSFSNRVMYSPPLLGLALGGAGCASAVSPRAATKILPLASWALILDGVIGFGFHIRGLARKPGGFKVFVTNLVMGPPIFAPLLLGIGGFLGLVASDLKPEETPAQNALNKDDLEKLRMHFAAATAAATLLNGFEALYSHYKSGFRSRSQWIPIVIAPPLVAASLIAIKKPRAVKQALPVFSGLAVVAGSLGFFFHFKATLRRPGIKQAPLYALIYGPPPLAPLLFAASGFLGLLASRVGRKADS